jgi:hypothetical protein
MRLPLPAQAPAAGKRAYPPAPGDRKEEEGPRLNLATALPLSVWQEHLRLCLYTREVLGLRVVCKALKGLVREWPMVVGVRTSHLEAALTCFPAAKHLNLLTLAPLAPAEESRLVELLRGHGGTLKGVVIHEGGRRRPFLSAVRAGALPSLTRGDFALERPTDREILSGGVLQLLEVVYVTMIPVNEEQVAALGHLRHLQHLRRLELKCNGALQAAFVPFIPPSLKVLTLSIDRMAALEPLLRGMPSMLQASGAGLKEICLMGEGVSPDLGAALAQVLRACSSTLKTLKLHDYQAYLAPRPPRAGAGPRELLRHARVTALPLGMSSAPSPPPAPPSRA